MSKHHSSPRDHGSIELIALGLLAALLVVLAVPLFTGIDEGQESNSEQESSSHP